MNHHTIARYSNPPMRFFIFILPFLFVATSSIAQNSIGMNDLSAFEQPSPNWKLVGKVMADLNHSNILKTTRGTGVLVNIPDKKSRGGDLFTTQSFSDVDVEMDYMMAKGSNSGIYLQGRYELQLHDSWGVLKPAASDNGGIYERFDEARGTGNEGYDGHAPRQNVSRAPGLWQHLKISFQAPKFDAAGRKMQNAKMLSVELNGVVIHENVDLSGPTRGAVSNEETASAPLRLQGDHGAVAFRNIVIRQFNGARPVMTNIHYSAYYSKYETIPDFSTIKPDEEGPLRELGTSFLKKDHEFLIRYTGIVEIKQPGAYIFQRETAGKGYVKINNQMVSNILSYATTPVQLAAGNYPFEIVYTKPANWFPTSFGLTVSSTDVREFLISDQASLFREYPDPIIIEAPQHVIDRCFIDLPGEKRIIHAANGGSAQQLHYSYDMDNGMLFQVWRGAFLDATSMWHGRGDGSSRPLGSLVYLGVPHQQVVQLRDAGDSISNDTSVSYFITKGYEMETENRTAFLYQLRGVSVRDALEVEANGQSLKRTVTVSNDNGNMYMRIAEGKVIENTSKGWYTIDDNTYYIRIDDPKVNPVIRQVQGHSELIAPLQRSISYSILF